MQVFSRKFDAVAVDEQNVRRSDAGFRATRKCSQHFRQKLWRHSIVAGGDVEKFAGCQIEAAIERGIESLARNLMKSKSRIGASDRFKKFPSPIDRLAIENDRFPIGKCLVEQRIDSRLKKFPRVERREQNGNFRRASRCHRAAQLRRTGSNSSSKLNKPLAKSRPVKRRARSLPR